MGGEMHHHGKLTVGYFAQHQVDELSPERTAYNYFEELMPQATVSQRRAKLGSYGFGATLADSPTRTLSGGEKARLLFALAAFHAPHILVLDEPTNHLDVDSREALIHAINDYEGAVILISHERHLIETCADRLWLVADGTVKPFDGDMDDYTRLVLEKSGGRAPRRNNKEPAAKPAKLNPVALSRQVQDLESSIATLQDKLAVLDRALADPDLYAQDPRKAADFAKLRTKLAADLDRAESRWLEAQDSFSDA
jgi:ATP-binding cassette subfamily F protein 3